jgi:hypothetical protein
MLACTWVAMARALAQRVNAVQPDGRFIRRSVGGAPNAKRKPHQGVANKARREGGETQSRPVTGCETKLGRRPSQPVAGRRSAAARPDGQRRGRVASAGASRRAAGGRARAAGPLGGQGPAARGSSSGGGAAAAPAGAAAGAAAVGLERRQRAALQPVHRAGEPRQPRRLAARRDEQRRAGALQAR